MYKAASAFVESVPAERQVLSKVAMHKQLSVNVLYLMTDICQMNKILRLPTMAAFRKQASGVEDTNVSAYLKRRMEAKKIDKHEVPEETMDMQKVPDKRAGRPTVVDPKPASDGDVPGTESWETPNSSKQDNGEKKGVGLTKEAARRMLIAKQSADKLGAPDWPYFDKAWKGAEDMQGRVRKELEYELGTGKIPQGTAIPGTWVDTFRQTLLKKIKDRPKQPVR
jgi:hypothetical protein